MLKRILTLTVVAVAVVMLGTVPAAAQTCAGGPAFSTAPLQVGTGLLVADGAKSYDVAFMGGSNSAFGGIDFSRMNINGTDISSRTLTGLVGGQAGGRVAVCPVGQLGYTFGPDLALFEVKTLHTGGGMRVGVMANDSDVFRVVPTAGVDFVWARSTVTDFLGGKETGTDHFWSAGAGVGLIFSQRVAVVPGFTFPFADGEDGTHVSFSLKVAFNFGG
jgi:hypothetical protein